MIMAGMIDTVTVYERNITSCTEQIKFDKMDY